MASDSELRKQHQNSEPESKVRLLILDYNRLKSRTFISSRQVNKSRAILFKPSLPQAPPKPIRASVT